MTERSSIVDDVVEETRADLAALTRRHAGDTAAQIRAIYLVGLEREQLVAVAYREDTLRARLEALPVGDEARDVIRHAMRWVWKEEQMHATFVRGVLLRAGGPVLRARAFLQQVMGAIAGWSASVLHHVPWRAAPLSRFWAHVFTFGGWLAGRVPRSVTRTLRHLSFREYCRFSLSAEATAALCWHRVAELLEASGDGAAALHYAQMGRDEDHHGAIFALLLEALDEAGGLRDGWDAARLRERLAAIGPFYVAREHRPDAAACPLGSGGQVVVVCDHAGHGHAEAEGDGAIALRTLLAKLDLDGLLAARAAATGKPVSQLKVAIKSSFMRSYHRDDPSVMTSPTLVRALASTLRERGVGDVALLESKAIYDWFYRDHDVISVARYVGLEMEGLRIVDVEADLVPHTFRRGMAQTSVSRTWRDADLRISFGKLSTHPIDHVYLGLAQLEALSPAADENVFVDRKTHRGPATMALIGELPPHLALLDAYAHVPDGLGGIIACDRPKTPRRLYGGRDAIAVDLVAARHVGELSPDVSPHIDAALHWFDDPRDCIEVVGCDARIEGWRGPCHDELSSMLSFLAGPVYVLASGRGELFAPEMDDVAFPRKSPAPFGLGTAQRMVRWLLGTRRPRIGG